VGRSCCGLAGPFGLGAGRARGPFAALDDLNSRPISVRKGWTRRRWLFALEGA